MKNKNIKEEKYDEVEIMDEDTNGYPLTLQSLNLRTSILNTLDSENFINFKLANGESQNTSIMLNNDRMRKNKQIFINHSCDKKQIFIWLFQNSNCPFDSFFPVVELSRFFSTFNNSFLMDL